MAISGHRNEASLRNYIVRFRIHNSDILSDALSGRPHQSQQPNFTALSSRAIYMFLWIRLSFIYKTHAFSSLSFYFSCIKTCGFFCKPQCGRILLKISLSYIGLRLKKKKAKVLNSTCRTISVCEPLHIVNFDGLSTLMVWHFWQLWSYSTNQIIWTILTKILIGLL